MHSVLEFIAVTALSLVGAYVGLIISVYSEFDVLTAFLIASGFVLGCRFFGKLDRKKFWILYLSIVSIWIVAWFVFCPLIAEKTPAGARWYYHNRNDVKADIAAIAFGLVLMLFLRPNMESPPLPNAD